MPKIEKHDPATIRLEWLERKHAKAIAEYHFCNGFRAGLECALLAIKEGRDIIGYSIDDGKAEIR